MFADAERDEGSDWESPVGAGEADVTSTPAAADAPRFGDGDGGGGTAEACADVFGHYAEDTGLALMSRDVPYPPGWNPLCGPVQGRWTAGPFGPYWKGPCPPANTPPWRIGPLGGLVPSPGPSPSPSPAPSPSPSPMPMPSPTPAPAPADAPLPRRRDCRDVSAGS